MSETLTALFGFIWPPFLLALGDQLACLMFLNLSGQKPLLTKSNVGIFILSIFLSIPLQRGGGLNLGTYTSLAAQLAFYFVFVLVWTRQTPGNSLYLSMVYFLTSDCLHIFCSFLSQKYFGYDIFITGTPIQLLCVNLIMTMLLLVSVRGVRYFVSRAGQIVIRPAQIPLLCVSLVPYLFIRGIVIWLPIQNEDLHGEIPVMLFVTLTVGLILMIGNVNMVSAQRHAYELHQMEQVLASQHAQFLSSQENADLINRKYHDLKNTLLYLRDCTDQEEIRNNLDRMWEQIQPYEISVKTGSHTIDILLNQKLALCQTHKISCIPYIDGTLLNFIAPLDLCTLFGNAMDNAIEAAMQVSEPEKRQIQIKTARKNQMVILRFTNTCSSIPMEQNGHLITSKKDTLSHGYGIRNMKQTVQAYGGQLSFEATEGHFTLNIILPLPVSEAGL